MLMLIKYIYTFFVGLFVAIFVAMGISAFYPQPESPDNPPTMYAEKPTPVDQEQARKYEQQSKDFQVKMKLYDRKVSILALISAVVILAVAIIYTEKLGPLADGLLLGGIFTLLYGTIRGLGTDSDKFRFLVATVGLGVALCLGYLKFIRAEAPAKKSKTGKKRK